MEAYEDEPDVSTTLVEGHVCFHFNDRDYRVKKVVMKPGQKLVYSSTSGDVRLYATSGLSETAWKDGKIIFSNTPLEVALRMLEKRFNVTFIIKNTRLKQMRLRVHSPNNGLNAYWNTLKFRPRYNGDTWRVLIFRMNGVKLKFIN